MKKTMEELNRKLADSGFKSSAVSIEHLPGLKSHLENFLEQGMLDREIYNEVVSL